MTESARIMLDDAVKRDLTRPRTGSSLLLKSSDPRVCEQMGRLISTVRIPGARLVYENSTTTSRTCINGRLYDFDWEKCWDAKYVVNCTVTAVRDL